MFYWPDTSHTSLIKISFKVVLLLAEISIVYDPTAFIGGSNSDQLLSTPALVTYFFPLKLKYY